jgi:hypothetical protein
MKTKINHLAVWVCVVLLHVLGFLWYGPLFGEKWMAMVGLDMAKAQADGGDAGIWIANFIASVAPIYALAWIFSELGVVNGVRGAVIAFVLTFSLHHLPTMSGNMFAQMPYGLAWITGGYSLVAYTICGFILGAWTKKSA